MDLEAMTIQRGRDAGLPSYNEARKAYGLSPVKSFRDINRNLSSEVRLSLTAIFCIVECLSKLCAEVLIFVYLNFRISVFLGVYAVSCCKTRLK